jgi:hypothetical protein
MKRSSEKKCTPAVVNAVADMAFSFLLLSVKLMKKPMCGRIKNS